MSIAIKPSKVHLSKDANTGQTVFEFLCERFSHISAQEWRSRFLNGKVHWLNGEQITVETPFLVGRTVCYYREVTQEPKIPFAHQVIYQNDHIVVADKPHFLQVTPGGNFVNECLLARLQRQLNADDLVPLHRLDRDTAGLVLFSLNPSSRALYSELFSQRNISKTYLAVAKISEAILSLKLPNTWKVENKIKSHKNNPTCYQVEANDQADINAKSRISLKEVKNGQGLFELSPITGKTHQLRLHMLSIGMPILNDRFYPELKSRESFENYAKPLQLLAKALEFSDPISGEMLNFESSFQLNF